MSVSTNNNKDCHTKHTYVAGFQVIFLSGFFFGNVDSKVK